MITDSFFQIGTTHEVCEDYALHGKDYAVISDGCSNGGGQRIDTDWGSRLLCKIAAAQLPLHADYKWDKFIDRVASVALCATTQIPDLSPESLTATLVTAYHTGGEIITFMMGDGVWAGRKRDGTWNISVFEFVPGGKTNQAAPYYLKYTLFEDDQKRYFNLFGGNYKLTIYTGDLLNSEKPMSQVVLTQPLVPDEPYFYGQFPTKDYDYVFIGTDGLTSFYHTVQTPTSKHNEPVGVLDVLRVLLDEKNITPGVLRRQRNWNWKRNMPGTFVGRNWHNSDDVSLAVVGGGPA